MFGGSFDPVTSSHLKMAAEIIHTGAADEVWLVRNKSVVVFFVAGLLTVFTCDMYIFSFYYRLLPTATNHRCLVEIV